MTRTPLPGPGSPADVDPAAARGGGTARAVTARRAALANLVCQIGIVVTGGLVRLTGSGLGCPTWPTCTADSLAPVAQQAEGIHSLIEFGNRLLTGVIGVVALAVLVTVLRLPGGRRDRRLLLLAAAPIVLTLAQAVLGGITVRTRLSPVTVSAHMLLSMVAIAVSTVLWLRLRERAGGGPAADLGTAPAAGPGRFLLAGLAAVVLVLGTVVTGSGPHSGDADEPARYGVALEAVSRVHALAVWAFVAVLVGLWRRHRHRPGAAAGRIRLLGMLVAAQATIGYVQYALQLPWTLVWVHVLLAALFAAAVTAVVDALGAGGTVAAAAAHPGDGRVTPRA